MAKVTFVESATATTGKPFKKVTLDEEVLGRNKFNVMSWHTRYADVVVGRAFDASEFEKDGQYIKLSDPDAGIKRPFARKGADPVAIAMAQQNKADNIEKAQDNKDKAIRLSGSMNHAVTVVTAFNKDLTAEETKKKILNWRDWFLENWDVKGDPDPSEIPF